MNFEKERKLIKDYLVKKSFFYKEITVLVRNPAPQELKYEVMPVPIRTPNIYTLTQKYAFS